MRIDYLLNHMNLTDLAICFLSIAELEYLKLQFWAVSASCFTVLVFLCIICQHQAKNIDFISSKINLNAKHSFICIASLGFYFSSLFGGK